MTEFAQSKSIERLDLTFNRLSDENLKPLLASKTLQSVSLDDAELMERVGVDDPVGNKMRGKLQKMTKQNQHNKQAYKDWKDAVEPSFKTRKEQSSSRGRS